MSEDVDRVMFVYATLELPVTVANAIDRLDRVMASQRLDELSDQAYEKGLVTLARVGPFGAVRGLSKAVRLQMLEPRSIDNGVRVQLRWVATGATGQLYPTLDADLDITGRRRSALRAVGQRRVGSAAGCGRREHRPAATTPRRTSHHPVTAARPGPFTVLSISGSSAREPAAAGQDPLLPAHHGPRHTGGVTPLGRPRPRPEVRPQGHRAQGRTARDVPRSRNGNARPG